MKSGKGTRTGFGSQKDAFNAMRSWATNIGKIFQSRHNNYINWRFQFDPNQYAAPTITKLNFNIGSSSSNTLEIKKLLDLDTLVSALISDTERPLFTKGEIELYSFNEPVAISASYPAIFQIGVAKYKTGTTFTDQEGTEMNAALAAGFSGSFGYKSLTAFKETQVNFSHDTESTFDPKLLFTSEGRIDIVNLLNAISKRYSREEMEGETSAPESAILATIFGKDDGVNRYLFAYRYFQYHMVPRDVSINP